MGSGGKAVGKRLLCSREAMGAGRALVSPSVSLLLPHRFPTGTPIAFQASLTSLMAKATIGL